MIGVRVPDGTLVWFDVDRQVHASGPKAEFWRKRVRTPHKLPDYAAKEAAEAADPGRIVEPALILRRPHSIGEVMEIVRKLCYIDEEGEPEEWVQIPEADRTPANRANDPNAVQ